MKQKLFSFILCLSLININAQNACEPYLILLQQTATNQACGVNTRTPCVVQNYATIESQPFDGMCVDIPASWSLMKSSTTLSYNDVYTNWLKPIDDALVKFNQNFVIVFTDKPGDLFDDVSWNKVIQNFKVLAQAAKAANFKGVFYDNEEYQTAWQNYPDDYSGTTKTLKEFQDQARLRGKQVMEAMVSEFPDIIIMTLHGPYASEPKVPNYVTMVQIGDASQHELLGPFFVGMVEGMGTQARIVDGGEVYQYRSVADFQNSYDWRKTTIANSTTNCAFIPTSLRPEWGNKVEIGFGVYNREWKSGYPMNPAIMKTTLINALNRTDSYVWYYTEVDDWTKPGAMPQVWRDTVKNANMAVIRNCGGDTFPVSSVSLSASTISLPAGSTSQLSATVLPVNASNINVSWSSGNNAIATVNSSGLVSAVSVGNTLVIVNTNDGNKKDTCYITVTNVSTENLLVNPGFEQALTLGWTYDWDNAIVSSAEKNSGTYSLVVGPASGGRAQPVTAGFSVDSTYIVSAYGMLSSAGEGASVGALCKDALGNTTGNFFTEEFTNTASFEKKEVSFIVPANTTSIEVYLWYDGGTATFYVDDFMLESASNSIITNDKTIHTEDYATVYPNPSRSIINIQSTDVMKEIVISNLQGVLVFEKSVNSKQFVVDLSSFQKGIYSVVIITTNKALTKMVIVQ